MHSSCRCELVEKSDGKVPTCTGDDIVGQPCNDGSDCSIDDEYVCNVEVRIKDLRCKGTASGLPCDDNNECTANDKCVEIPGPSYEDTVFTCLGELIEDKPCDDGDPCTIDDVCDYYIARPEFSECRGTREGGPCF
jgi:hypothetical protein